MKLGLKGRFLIPTLTVLILGLGLTTAVGYFMAAKAMTKNIHSQLLQVAGFTGEKIDTYFKSCKNDLLIWGQDKIFQMTLQDSFGSASTRKVASEHLQELQKVSGRFVRVSLVNTAGEVIASSDQSAVGKVNVADREFFKQSLQGKIVVSEALISKTNGAAVVNTSAPIKEKDQVIGVIFGNVDLNSVAGLFIDPVKVGEQGYGFIVQHDGLTVVHRDKERMLKENIKDTDFGRVMLSQEEGLVSYSYQGEGKILSFKKSHEAGWIVGVIAFEHDILAPVKHLGLINSGAAAGIILVAALVVLLTASSIVKSLNRIGSRLLNGAGQVASASAQLASSSQELADGSSNQAASLEETSSSLEEMASMVKLNAENAVQAGRLMKETSQVVGRADASMAGLTASMEEISKASVDTQKIVKTIDEIAFQTNLLALNAAVEAARAGEAGAGFAVVADEVRNLAMRAAEAARSTAGLIETTVKKVNDGAHLAQKTNTEFHQVAEAVKRSDALVAEISAASQEQAQGIDQINHAVNEMDRVTQQNAANAEESASASEEMSAQAVRMEESVAELIALVGGKSGIRRSTVAKLNRQSAEPGAVPSASVQAPLPRKTDVKDSLKKSMPTNGNGSGGLKLISPEKVIPFEEDFRDF